MARAPRQTLLPGFEGLKIRKFGGSELKGNAREARPISVKRPLHVVMKSSLAKGELSFLRAKRARSIEKLARRLGRGQRVKVLRFANSGNHLHLLVLPSSKRAFNSFIRALTGLIARLTLGAERGRAKGVQFWDAKPFTRIVEWGRDFRGVCRYILVNTLEAIGFPDIHPRKYPAPG